LNHTSWTLEFTNHNLILFVSANTYCFGIGPPSTSYKSTKNASCFCSHRSYMAFGVNSRVLLGKNWININKFYNNFIEKIAAYLKTKCYGLNYNCYLLRFCNKFKKKYLYKLLPFIFLNNRVVKILTNNNIVGIF